MLTRIEIDAFKTFEEFSLVLGPFAVVLGANAVGKSNLFDAIRLLSQLADRSDLRSALEGLRGEPHELFRRGTGGERASRMRFAVEVLLDPRVTDPWGVSVDLDCTRVRYEIELELRVEESGLERLIVTREEARPIPAKTDRWPPGERAVTDGFARRFIRRPTRKTPWLETVVDGDSPTFRIRQDMHAGRPLPAKAAGATVLSSITRAEEFPTLFALREELRSWRFLQLDPVALRQPSDMVMGRDDLVSDGHNLASVLARIAAETRTAVASTGVIANIEADLTALIPGVKGVSVIPDLINRRYQLDVEMRDGAFSSRVVSDGTLRILGLLTLLHDPQHHGLLCFEEPENGIHPLRLKALLERLRSLVTDPRSTGSAEGDGEAFEERAHLSQLLLNSHSPVVLSCLLREGDVLFADMVQIIDPATGSARRRTRIRPVDPEMLLGVPDATKVSRHEVNRYLATVDQPSA